MLLLNMVLTLGVNHEIMTHCHAASHTGITNTGTMNEYLNNRYMHYKRAALSKSETEALHHSTLYNVHRPMSRFSVLLMNNVPYVCSVFYIY